MNVKLRVSAQMFEHNIWHQKIYKHSLILALVLFHSEVVFVTAVTGPPRLRRKYQNICTGETSSLFFQIFQKTQHSKINCKVTKWSKSVDKLKMMINLVLTKSEIFYSESVCH